MIAYFALLSFVPLIFLALALLGFTGRAERVELPRRASSSRLFPTHVDRRTSSASSTAIQDERDDARAHRRRVPALDVALALQRARVRVQHRLRAAEPLLPARQGPRVAVHGRLARWCCSSRSSSARSASSCSRRRAGRSSTTRSSRTALSVRVSTLGVFVFLVDRVLRADERRAALARGAARGGRRRRAARRRRSRCCRCSSASRRATTRCCGRSARPALLLVWLYVMANVIVFGAEINWWRARVAGRRRGRSRTPSRAVSALCGR